jgi:hypothetical protein
MKYIFYFLLLSAIFIAGWLVSNKFYSWPEKKTQEEQTAIVEKIREVLKLVTVEAQFAEIYDYKDYYGYDWSPFRKKALIRVKAKVSAGYDLTQLSISTHPEEKKIIIENIPEPKIMTVDHEIDYYDISEGTFNKFSVDDYNQLNKKAKDFIIKTAEESGLLDHARVQGASILQSFNFLVQSTGWEIIVSQPDFQSVSRGPVNLN